MNNKGFTIVEVICAFGLLIMISTAILPLLTELRTSQKALADERIITTQLQSELLQYKNETPDKFPFINKYELMTITFNQLDTYVEACATWETRHNNKELCLYASYKQ
ncbi:type II secretion system GspH family protein [Halobacillus shinanisalinarum]|uniref:Type II secretion system GspH family protein n=1 Tax=Halobacillus shinanisalinarum TaxID=2932258 RepID=A0ABY4H0L7_9BACI|nr:type II secretion system protein [Halobacillus shinanisalinarum]UOQ93726.1 type II secretion system GspH family protein [Halobacillus shinanisalinarum]